MTSKEIDADPDLDDDGDLNVEQFPFPAALLEAAGITTEEEFDAIKPYALHAGKQSFAGDFREQDHPRKSGKFAPKGGGDSGAKGDTSSDASDIGPDGGMVRKAVAGAFAPANGSAAKQDKLKPFKLKLQKARAPKPPRDDNAPEVYVVSRRDAATSRYRDDVIMLGFSGPPLARAVFFALASSPKEYGSLRPWQAEAFAAWLAKQPSDSPFADSEDD